MGFWDFHAWWKFTCVLIVPSCKKPYMKVTPEASKTNHNKTLPSSLSHPPRSIWLSSPWQRCSAGDWAFLAPHPNSRAHCFWYRSRHIRIVRIATVAFDCLLEILAHLPMKSSSIQQHIPWDRIMSLWSFRMGSVQTVSGKHMLHKTCRQRAKGIENVREAPLYQDFHVPPKLGLAPGLKSPS